MMWTRDDSGSPVQAAGSDESAPPVTASCEGGCSLSCRESVPAWVTRSVSRCWTMASAIPGAAEHLDQRSHAAQ